MAISVIDNLHCDLCDEKIDWGFEVHELSPDAWTVMCNKCADVLEVNEGK